MRLLKWAPLQYVWCPNKMRKLSHTEKPWGYVRTEQGPWARTVKMALCEPRREASGETNPADALILDFILQNCEKVNVCGLSLQYVVFFNASSSTLMWSYTLGTSN